MFDLTKLFFKNLYFKIERESNCKVDYNTNIKVKSTLTLTGLPSIYSIKTEHQKSLLF